MFILEEKMESFLYVSDWTVKKTTLKLSPGPGLGLGLGFGFGSGLGRGPGLGLGLGRGRVGSITARKNENIVIVQNSSIELR